MNTSFATPAVIINSTLSESIGTEWCSAMEKLLWSSWSDSDFRKELLALCSALNLRSERFGYVSLFFSCFKIFFIFMPV